ncbi:LysR family transcriptional regulator [Demequina capsici]|uniref:LysR family transcriptional regulator n=1 Tax=Demequina capsici TaxID=3075620 RepID=A0AA96FFH2_9MICO|nr:LysR family transcriptional regulator [Demequina sp. PMTSA13]WNM28462.1 LysR family transcriptional regulator [Demequina sp. PMTSA13]
MDLRSLDMNLLLPLHALLEERSVSRAAERLSLSQPALSASLAKLRRLFGDELLVRHGNSYELSPLAVSLRERTWVAVQTMERLFSAEAEFEPSTSDRDFRILGADYAFRMAGRELAMAVSAVAPRVRLTFETLSRETMEAAPESLRDCDGMILPHGFISSDRYMDLLDDRWVVVAARDNPDLGDELTVDDLATLPWVLAMSRTTQFTPAIRQMQTLGIEPLVEVVTPSFVTLPALVSGTRRLGLLQERLALAVQGLHGLRVLEFPVPIAPIKDAFWWNGMYDADPGHVWLRGMLAQVAESMAGEVDGRAEA